MIAGHFGFAAAVKSREPTTPLWALMLATVWLDVIFVPLLFMHVETVQPISMSHSGYGANIIHADYTHSIPGMVLLALTLGIPAAWLWGRRSGIVVALVVASHWLLDVPVHRADMAILPGNAGNLPRIGLGLWQYPLAAASLELLLVLIGAWLYLRSARRVATMAGRGLVAAGVVAAMIAAFGLLVLWMDYTAA